MRFKLPKDYDFTYFSDKENVNFKVNSTDDGSFVMPETPFSIIDKVDFLHSIGFKRVLIDFSKTKVQKTHFKQVYQALIKKQILPETFRFNWKDGFYSQEKIDNYKAASERNNALGAKNANNRKGSNNQNRFNKTNQKGNQKNNFAKNKPSRKK